MLPKTLFSVLTITEEPLFTLLKGPNKNGVNVGKSLQYINLGKFKGPETNDVNDGKM
jgi:hypothetical protein